MDSLSDKSERARNFARQNNEYNAKLVKDYPGRFGCLAALASARSGRELERNRVFARHAQGRWHLLFTDYVDKWVGDPMLAPAFDELNRRKAVVFFHPARANCCAIFRDSRESSIRY